MAKVRIGMAQMRVEFSKPEENLKRMEGFLQRAQGRADLVLFPECCDLGWGNPRAADLCHEIPGETSRRYAELAQKYHLWVAAGITERAGGRVYNAALLLSDRGETLLHHRKINVLTGVEDVYAIGDRLGVADTPFGRIALDICADNFANSAVIGEVFGRMGADLLLSPSAWGIAPDRDLEKEPYGAEWHQPYALLSKKYQMAVVGVSNVGRLEDGPWQGWPVIGNSIAYDAHGQLAAVLPCGEGAEALEILELETLPHPRKGTALAEFVTGGL